MKQFFNEMKTQSFGELNLSKAARRMWRVTHYIIYYEKF